MKGALAGICLSGTALIIVAGMANQPRSAAAASAPACQNLASNPQLSNNGVVKSITSTTTKTAAGTPYCNVTLVYGTNPSQNITIVVGLPLNGTDLGSGPAQGNWNGRTEGLGGGVCAGNLNVDAAVNANYVGSGTDGGGVNPTTEFVSALFQCSLWVNANHTFNSQAIEDFFRIGIKQEILFSKQIAGIYYQMNPVYNYWNGCSTGGRQGYLLAQELPDELDGILANAPAMYWTRFQTAMMWGQIAMFDLAGESPPGAIPLSKLQAVQQAAIGACDKNDSAQDGIIDDPRTCNFSASANICPASGPQPPNCVPLTSAEAAAVDKIWDGPRNQRGNRIWFPLDRGTDFSGVDGPSAFPNGVIQFEWDEIDQSYAFPLIGPPPSTIPTSTKWQSVTLAGVPLSYPQVAQDGSNNIADVTDTFGPLDGFMQRGGKLLTIVGANDQLIFPRGVINYYRTMARRYQTPRNATQFDAVQNFYRLFRAPGVGHCGGSGFGPWPQNGQDFAALVNWVEHGIAPTQVTGTYPPPSPQNPNPTPTLTRNLCPYPQTAVYNGTGNVDDASSFQCGGNLETPAVVCADVVAKYKHEVNGPLDYQGSGTSPAFCNAQNGN
jgi:feruloyl esterase